jgi:hypothetical protein
MDGVSMTGVEYEQAAEKDSHASPIALSIVEGCAQSPRYNVVENWNTGVME